MKIKYFILLFLGGIGGFYIFNSINPGFENLNTEEMHKRIIEERDIAIAKAVKRGDYRCCISPPCTMCYMEANKWNNFTAGTCACDDLEARGEEACPQCERGLDELHDEDNTFCDINTKVPTCDSNK
jgi:hypothetical protein